MAKEDVREALRKVIRGVPKTIEEVERAAANVKKVVDASRASSLRRAKPTG